MNLAGTHTALITPISDGRVDEAQFRQLIDAQFEAGITGIVPVGTTGESPTLSHEEHQRVIQVAIEGAQERGLVIAGTGSNSTTEAVSLTKAAEEAGADAALLVAPYYNKPSQEGLFQHYKEIASSVDFPIVLYSIPGRCGIEIGVETVARLQEACSNIIAIKEAGGSTDRVSQLVEALPDSFQILSGDDSMSLPFISQGAHGVISVASNLLPGPMSELVSAALEGNFSKAKEIHNTYFPLFNAFLKLDTNPIPIKTAMGLADKASPDLRLPLVAMADDKKEALATILKNLKIIS